MSLVENSAFLKAFNRLDHLLKDMYPSDIPSKLGITRYLEEMQRQAPSGRHWVANWERDYSHLKALRNFRNQMVHEDLLDSDLISSEDILWISSFHDLILARRDPLATLYQKQQSVSRQVSPSSSAASSAPRPVPPQKPFAAARLILILSGLVIFLAIVLFGISLLF